MTFGAYQELAMVKQRAMHEHERRDMRLAILFQGMGGTIKPRRRTKRSGKYEK